MRQPLVSVIVDNYNYGRYLAQSIESALAQTYARTEVIVVDDASTDDSPTVIRRYARVVPVFKAVNSGQASALNAGFLASHGEIVIFLDADDYLEPDAVAREEAVGGIPHRDLDFLDRARIRSFSSIQRSLKALEAAEKIELGPNGWQVADPLFALWLKGGGGEGE